MHNSTNEQVYFLLYVMGMQFTLNHKEVIQHQTNARAFHLINAKYYVNKSILGHIIDSVVQNHS